MDIVLVDMDGVIADDSDRKWIANAIPAMAPEDKQRGWDLYHSLMKFDSPMQGIINEVNSLPADTVIVILTGRPEKWRKETKEQLKNWGVTYHSLMMRCDGDRQSAVHFKKRIAIHLQEIGLNIVKAYDDRADICEAYRQLEIPTVEIN